MKPHIKAVIFDFGGVALDYSFRGQDYHVAQHLGVSEHHARRIRKRHAIQSHRGMTALEHLHALAHDLGADIRAVEKAHHLAFEATNRIRPAVMRLVKELRKLGYLTPLISNTCDLYARFNIKKGWFKLFSPLILSHEVGHRKPEKRIYDLALKKIRAKPEECVFIDDQERCLKPARRMGMHAIKYTTLANVKKKLKKLGVL
jgi:putative hydrolase of the HAD superfamily